MDHKSIDWNAVREFFFIAMLVGYAGDKSVKEKVPNKPGFKFFKYEDHETGLRLVDEYHTTQGSDHSTGMTTIWLHDEVIWVMHYGGWYENDAISLLKQVLNYAYKTGLFLGGRGPAEFVGEGWNYQNFLKYGADSLKFPFEGKETLYIGDETMLGEHWYHGGPQV